MKPRLFLILILLAVFPLILSSVATPFPETIRSISNQTFKPIFQASNLFSDSLGGLLNQARDFFDVYEENKILRKKVSLLKLEIYKLKEDVKKIERLQVLIPLLDKQPKGITLAQVIFRDISLWNQSIVIDKGASQGIEKDMVVISNQGLVGRVIAVSHSTAHVLLLTDFHSRVSCQSHESRDVGILCGEISKQLRVKYLDLNSTIKIGDTIISSGIGGIYSKGIPIGTVTMVGLDDDGLHLYALVNPFVKFSKLEEVLCLERTIKEQDFFSLPS